MRWTLLFVKTILALVNRLSNYELYYSVHLDLQFFQTLALLEVVHSAIGLVRSPVVTTIKQVTSRIVVVWLLLYVVRTSRHSIGVPLILIAWPVTEVIRYSFYALTLINKVPWVLKWMRYTFFIVLYPVGALGEILIALAALPEIAVKKHLTLEMPNNLNCAFSFWWFIALGAAYYPIGFPPMYFYMFKQRNKALYIEDSKKRN
uniref:Very-long-chain (3R)-3-hydroxyacyl-CoA dehydratase n=1 Tax=Syphacia muris TaxID=451379 RepID=A0A0N5AIN9_9BILA